MRLDILVYLLTRGAEPHLGQSKSVVEQARRRQVRLQVEMVVDLGYGFDGHDT